MKIEDTKSWKITTQKLRRQYCKSVKLQCDDIIISDNQLIVNKFAKYSANSFRESIHYTFENKSNLFFLPFHNPHSMFVSSETDTLETISSLKNKNSSGANEISYVILKYVSDSVISLFTIWIFISYFEDCSYYFSIKNEKSTTN